MSSLKSYSILDLSVVSVFVWLLVFLVGERSLQSSHFFSALRFSFVFEETDLEEECTDLEVECIDLE